MNHFAIKNQYLFVFILQCTVLSSVVCTASGKTDAPIPTLLTPQISGFYDGSGDGYFGEINRLIEQQLQQRVPVTALPLARAVEAYKNREYDCFLGANRAAIQTYLDEPELDIIDSEDVLTTSVIIITSNKNLPLTKSQQLKGKTVGIQLGSDPDHMGIGHPRVNFVHVKTVKSLLTMLDDGRVDAIVVYYPHFQLSDNGVSKFHLSEPIKTYLDAISCFNTKINRAFLYQINPIIRKLKSSGRLDALYKKFFQSP